MPFKAFFTALIFLFTLVSHAQNIGINDQGLDPDSSAILDLNATDKGLLIPRVALVSLSSNAPIGNNVATSLMIYNTTANGELSPGFYYWNGASWSKVQSSSKRKMTFNVFSAGLGGGTTVSSSCVYLNGEQVSCSGRAIHLTVFSGTNGALIHSQTYDNHLDQANGDILATDIATFNTTGNILILNTHDQPSYMSTNLINALRDEMQSKRIADETQVYRNAWCIAFQNGKGKLGEDISNSTTTTYGDRIHATAAIHFTTWVGL